VDADEMLVGGSWIMERLNRQQGAYRFRSAFPGLVRDLVAVVVGSRLCVVSPFIFLYHDLKEGIGEKIGSIDFGLPACVAGNL
jgi:hypothetical protein